MHRARDRSRSGGGLSLLQQATAYLGGIAPYHWWDFINDRALFTGVDVGTVTSTPGWSYTRADAQSAYAETSAGVLVPFATGVLRRTDKGILIESARTNLALWSRDFTNAAWVKVNVTAALNQTGVDGVANSASSLTATSGLGTTLQTVISGSAARATTCYVKRITGTGTIEFTSDGVAYTDITSSLSVGSWFRATVTGTITNPVLGFRITTSGDAIAVDFAQLESATFASSPIPTTTTSAIRAADVLTVSSLGVAYPLTLFAEFERVVDTGAQAIVLAPLVDNNNRVLMNITAAADLLEIAVTSAGSGVAFPAVAGAVAVATVYKAAGRVETNNTNAARSGVLATNDTSCAMPTSPTTLYFGQGVGASGPLFGYIRRAAIVNSAVNDAGLQSMTT